ncbi:MAG TPA: hypothetical protein VN738_05110 [Acidothermaceae bacterium]|nr:hypothetical protein [Acidothermaceae bacterium]
MSRREGPLPELVTLPGELVERAISALRSAALASLTVKHSLDKPYSDAPEWTPWTRWVGPMAREAYDCKQAIADAVRPQRGATS